MQYNVDIIIQWYDRFLEYVSQVAMSAEKQKEKLLGVAVTDEIASDFSAIGMNYAKKLLACEYTVTIKESLLMGPGGGLVVESIWDGNRLLTVILKGW